MEKIPMCCSHCQRVPLLQLLTTTETFNTNVIQPPTKHLRRPPPELPRSVTRFFTFGMGIVSSVSTICCELQSNLTVFSVQVTCAPHISLGELNLILSDSNSFRGAYHMAYRVQCHEFQSSDHQPISFNAAYNRLYSPPRDFTMSSTLVKVRQKLKRLVICLNRSVLSRMIIKTVTKFR